MASGRFLHPASGEDLLALIHAPVEVQLSYAAKLADGHAQSRPTDGKPVFVSNAGRDGHFQRLKEAGAQVFQNVNSREFLHEDGEHIGAKAVVAEFRARLNIAFPTEKFRCPIRFLVAGLGLSSLVDHLALLPRGHGEQMAHADAAHAGGEIARGVFGEQIRHEIVQPKHSLRHAKAHGGGGVHLGHGKDGVSVLQRKGSVGARGDQLAVPHQHEGVGLLAGIVYDIAFKKREDIAGGNAHLLGRNRDERLHSRLLCKEWFTFR